MKLIITEKPSVAQSIAKALGVHGRKDGYIEGNDYIISWCIGHLVGLSPPEAYNLKYQDWKLEDLPILPENWRFFIAPETKAQFHVIEMLMQDERVDSVVCATDAGREGELIFRLVYEQAGCTKPIERLWLASMEESAIRDGFRSLRDGQQYDKLYASALCRAKADWLVGMNATRLYSTAYKTALHAGRVQTPTLAMLVEREKQIAAFQKEKSYSVQLHFDDFTAQSDVFSSRDEAAALLEACEKQRASILTVESKDKRLNPPKLYDLTSLQRDANRILGCTAQQALDAAQKLYEKKYLTYPRTDSQHITADMTESATEIAALSCQRMGYANFEPSTARMVADDRVNDHHALLPTKQGLEKGVHECSGIEHDLLQLVIKRVALASASPYEGIVQMATLRCADTTFSAKGELVTHKGFMALDGEGEKIPHALPELTQGDVLTCKNAELCEHESAPPKHFTEDTLLSAMERAGNADLDESLETEKSGIGTPATRAGFIEKLIKSGYAERKGKQILPTDKGVHLIAIVPEALRSPKMTAEWENELTRIAKGEASADFFMNAIEDFVERLIVEGKAQPVDESLFRIEQPSVGVCPRCGNHVLDRPKGYCCEDRSCGFAMWKNDLFFKSKKKQLTKTLATALLKNGKTAVKGLYSEKTGKKYDATILLDDSGDGYVRYKLSFDK